MNATKSTERPRRRKRKPQIENHYKALGLRANAPQDKIKPKYIEMVKAYPPETHPEEFQRIRRAYEVLRDPVKRKEYDLLRIYGDSVEALLEDAYNYMENEQWEKAAELFRKALEIDPDSRPSLLGLAFTALNQEDEPAFQDLFNRAMERASSDEERAGIISHKARLLTEMERWEDALGELDRFTSQFPEHKDRLKVAYTFIYIELGRADEAYALAESAVPDIESQTPEDIDRFVDWIHVTIKAKKWNLWSKVQSRVRQFLKSIREPEDKLMVVSTLLHEFGELFGNGSFREAEIFMEFAYFTDPKHSAVVELRREAQNMARMQKEVERLMKDDDIFPLVTVQAFEWFYEGYLPDEFLEMSKSMLPPPLVAEMESMNEEFAAGIMKLKKKYPLLYREFQEDWEELYEEKTAGLNRQTRRRLR